MPILIYIQVFQGKLGLFGTKDSRMDQVKFVEDNLWFILEYFVPFGSGFYNVNLMLSRMNVLSVQFCHCKITKSNVKE